jgi:hypothetical protein
MSRYMVTIKWEGQNSIEVEAEGNEQALAIAEEQFVDNEDAVLYCPSAKYFKPTINRDLGALLIQEED